MNIIFTPLYNTYVGSNYNLRRYQLKYTQKYITVTTDNNDK